MNKIVRIVAIILCSLILIGSLLPLVVQAETLDNPTSIVLLDNETAETQPSNTESETKNEKWDGKCLINVALKSEITEKTDNIVIQFAPKGSLVASGSVILSRKNNFCGTIELVPDEYKISVLSADNKYEVILNENFAKVPEAKEITLNLTAKKVQDGGFVASFFRNNTFLLILLVISSITYYILRRKRLNNTYDTAQRDV